VKLQVLEVTPVQAKAWLKLNTLNRPVRSSYVAYLADAMKRGEWVVNHQPLAINGSRLIDGQHRLMAVVESGLSAVKMAVVTDADTATFDTIDIGVKRKR
jgi:hydrogenase maturation factor